MLTWTWTRWKRTINNSERPVDALAEKHQWLTDWLTTWNQEMLAHLKMDLLSFLILKHYSAKCSQIEIKIHRDKKCLVCIQLKDPLVTQRHFLKNRRGALSSLLRGTHWVLLRGTQVSSPCHQRGVSRWCWTYSQGKVLKLIKVFGLFCACSKVTKKIAGWYDCYSL